MPVIGGQSTATTEITSILTRSLAEGQGGRATLGARDQAFAWTSGLAPIVARAVTTSLVEGSQFTAVKVNPAGTPAAVAKGAAKSEWATLTSETVSLSKYAGYADLYLEDVAYGAGILAAVHHTLVNQALVAYDADVVSAIVAGADGSVTGASSYASGILEGIAGLLAGGANPDTLLMSGDVMATALESPGAGYVTDPQSAWQSLFGLRLVVSAGAPAGTCVVLDSSSVLCVESVSSPVVVVDPYSGLKSGNAITVVSELLAGVSVTGAGGVATVAVA